MSTLKHSRTSAIKLVPLTIRSAISCGPTTFTEVGQLPVRTTNPSCSISNRNLSNVNEVFPSISTFSGRAMARCKQIRFLSPAPDLTPRSCAKQSPMSLGSEHRRTST
uniref:(northern house mosquito) hypothetical protein n=1 Tax=Culex pipiens TaxID=7175 RepID=A0A8D8L8G8_CULPI